MLNPNQIYHRKNKILYDSSGKEIVKFKEITVDAENLTGVLVENMNKYIACYPERIEIIEKQTINLILKIMKKAIAMRCTREQFEVIKPKINKYICFNHIRIEEFNHLPYLTNYFEGKENLIANITYIGIQNYNRELVEEWNENTFLDACGIKIEKPIRTNKLTELEKRVEVLEHKVDLKNIADMPVNLELKQPFTGIKAPMYESILKSIKEGKIVIPKTTNIIEELKNYKPMSLNFGLDIAPGFMQPHLSDSFGIFQQYETLKQENNKLKLRVEELEAENKALLSAPNAAAISFTASSTFDFKDMPIAGTDVKELEVGKWYKCIEKEFESLVVITDLEGNKAYGFSYYGENDRNIWNDESNCGWSFKSDTKNWELATEQEVTEALTKEAVKRGFKEGVAVKYPWFSELNKQHYIYTPDFKEESILENERFLYLGCCVFCGGQWAEIIETVSLNDAEKILGKKII